MIRHTKKTCRAEIVKKQSCFAFAKLGWVWHWNLVLWNRAVTSTSSGHSTHYSTLFANNNHSFISHTPPTPSFFLSRFVYYFYVSARIKWNDFFLYCNFLVYCSLNTACDIIRRNWINSREHCSFSTHITIKNMQLVREIGSSQL